MHGHGAQRRKKAPQAQAPFARRALARERAEAALAARAALNSGLAESRRGGARLKRRFARRELGVPGLSQADRAFLSDQRELLQGSRTDVGSVRRAVPRALDARDDADVARRARAGRGL